MTNKKIEDRYKKLTHREHVLQRPGMYIGSITTETKRMFVFDDFNKDNKFQFRDVNYNPGFVKLFDEALTNASDHSIRTGKVKYIKIQVEKDTITIENDGPGIPIQIHKEHKIYVPEMIFYHLLSGENFDDNEERYVGGLHGLGIKLTNIFSKKFTVETADGKNKYKQTYSENLLKKSKPTITKSAKNYTKVTFLPDFEKFGMNEIDDDTQAIFRKRAIDIAAYNPSLKVYYNGILIPIRNFKDYMKMFTDGEIVYEQINDKWEVGISKSTSDEFQQTSMVNGISTINGGTHVNFISNMIIKTLMEKINKQHKGLDIKQSYIKNHLFLFLNCKIPNPLFDNQTKESLKTKLSTQIIKDVELSDNFYKKIISSELKNDIVNFINLKEFQEAKKETEGASRKSKLKIRKLEDAIKAGTVESWKCSLFLTEGDSAASTAKRGFSITGRDYYGLFPLKGKPTNVRNLSLHKMREDEEITSIISALGLEIGKKYTSTRTLRYGKLVIMTDADHDGSHIKGLIINLLDTYWSELLRLDFLYEFITPVIKTKKGNNIKYFYTVNEYKKWKNTVGNDWYIKWLKGLGSIEPAEAKQFFKELHKHLIKFNSADVSKEREYIDLVFNDKRTDDRKEWLLLYKPGLELDKFNIKQTYESFFDNEYKEFSIADNIRSIPSVVDGLKPSQRKILYTLFKRNFKNEVKVELLIGSIIELSAYHHGPKSLEDTIVGMAQDYTGANNINLLEPNGEFGTRSKGGEDASASRYIFTNLTPISKKIFVKEDEPTLTDTYDDGYQVEPAFYVPIIPMVLVNGSDGIGTGWKSYIPNFNPKDIITYLEKKIRKEKKNIELIPWYKGFKGEIIKDIENGRYITRGIISKTRDNHYKISELPIGTWNKKYLEYLDSLITKQDFVLDYEDHSTDTDINIQIKVSNDTEDIYKKLKLETYLSSTNMILFDDNSKIYKYKDQYEIIDAFINIRLKYYQLRKDNIIEKLEYQKMVLLNKMKFIQAILKKQIIIDNKTKSDIENMIIKQGIVKIEDSYDYLFNIPIIQLSKEKLIELQEIFNRKKEEIEKVNQLTIEKMWEIDLSELKKLLI